MLLSSICHYFLIVLCVNVPALFCYVNCLHLLSRQVLYKHECTVELWNLMRLLKQPLIYLVLLF
jgi:hypothetical protein